MDLFEDPSRTRIFRILLKLVLWFGIELLFLCGEKTSLTKNSKQHITYNLFTLDIKVFHLQLRL